MFKFSGKMCWFCENWSKPLLLTSLHWHPHIYEQIVTWTIFSTFQSHRLEVISVVKRVQKNVQMSSTTLQEFAVDQVIPSCQRRGMIAENGNQIADLKHSSTQGSTMAMQFWNWFSNSYSAVLSEKKAKLISTATYMQLTCQQLHTSLRSRNNNRPQLVYDYANNILRAHGTKNDINSRNGTLTDDQDLY